MRSASGRSLSTSFIEWTEKSVSPASKARSSSLVHKALPPISASGRSWIAVAAGLDGQDAHIALPPSHAPPRAPPRPCAPAPAPAATRAFQGSVDGPCLAPSRHARRRAKGSSHGADPRPRIVVRRQRGRAGDERPAHPRPGGGRPDRGAPAVRRGRPRNRRARPCRNPARPDPPGAGRSRHRHRRASTRSPRPPAPG